MLILSRKEDEKIIIDFNGEIVEVMVVDIQGDKVRLGIEANRRVVIHREEVYRRLQAGETPCSMAKANTNVPSQIQSRPFAG